MSLEKEREHFKKQLFDNFRESGVLDFLKAQVRTSFVEKLRHKENTPSSQKKNISTEKKSTPKKTSEESYNQMAITLVLDFLEKNRFVYTNSVFLPEAKNIAQPLSKDQLLDSIDPKKTLFVSEDKPYLNSIIEYLIAALQQQDNPQRSNKKHPVEKSLNFNDENLEDRFTSLKREYEIRMDEQIKQEVERIKKFELINIRQEEGEKARRMMEEFRAEVEKNYNEKAQKLRDKEKEIIEKFKAQLKGLELANEDQKKSHFKDVEHYKQIREEMEGLMNKEKQAIMAERDRVSKLERELSKKIAEVQAEKDAIVKQTQDLVKSAKLEAIRDIDRERSAIFKLKNQVESDYEKIGAIRDRAETAEFQNKRLLETNKHLAQELEQARERVRDLERDLSHKKESVDYYRGGFDRENEQFKRLEKQIENFKSQIEDHEKAKEEYRIQLDHKRRELVDSNQRYIKEIESYQQLVERVSKEKETLRRRINELEDEVKHLVLSQIKPQDPIKFEEDPSKDFLEASFGDNDPRMKLAAQEVAASHRKSEIDTEIKQLQKKREQEVASLMLEPSVTKGVLKKKETQGSPSKKSLVDSFVSGSPSLKNSRVNVSFKPTNSPLNQSRDKSDLLAIREYYSKGLFEKTDDRLKLSRVETEGNERGTREVRFNQRLRERDLINETESFDETDPRFNDNLIIRTNYDPKRDKRALSIDSNAKKDFKL